MTNTIRITIHSNIQFRINHKIGKTMTISGWDIDQQTSETEFSVSTILYKAMVVGYTSSDCCGVRIFPIYLA